MGSETWCVVRIAYSVTLRITHHAIRNTHHVKET